MNRHITTAILLALTIATTKTTNAELVPNSMTRLQKQSTHVVTGKVESIYTYEEKDAEWLKTYGVVEIRLERIEKGENLESGHTIYARFWRQTWIGQGVPPTFASGHQLPRRDDTIRGYLQRKDGRFEALLPNGFEIISGTKAEKKQ
jgi:hypothetical protein